MEQITTDLTDGILTITLNRPDRLNAWTPTMARELIETFDRADADDDVRVVIITGAGRGFCAGADLERGGETFDWRARGGDGPPRDNGGQLLSNPNDYRWAQAALLAGLDRWVRKGVAPPPSSHPTLSDATLVAQSKIKYPSVPGVQWPVHVPGGYRVDVPGPVSVLPFLVPQVDRDGNDITGIRSPEQAVPLGTYADWSFRSEAIGAPVPPIDRAEHEQNVAAVHAALGKERFAAAWAEGRARTLEEAMQEALQERGTASAKQM